MGDVRNAYKILVRKPEGQRHSEYLGTTKTIVLLLGRINLDAYSTQTACLKLKIMIVISIVV
jgi:hypothetical protein